MALTDGIGGHERRGGGGVLAVVCCFQKPARHVVKGFPAFGVAREEVFQVVFLLRFLPGGSQVGRIPTNVSLPALVGKINFRLLQGGVK